LRERAKIKLLPDEELERLNALARSWLEVTLRTVRTWLAALTMFAYS